MNNTDSKKKSIPREPGEPNIADKNLEERKKSRTTHAETEPRGNEEKECELGSEQASQNRASQDPN